MSDKKSINSIDKILPINLDNEMRASYLDYAMSVIIGRALPDVRDGLKPVHRRVLYAMQDLSNSYNRPYKKSARIVGDVIGKYHPHGDQAVYDTMVRMAQEFSMRYMLVDGQGNFGSIDGDSAAAMRYTEVRMTKLASQMLIDLEKDTVDFTPNYDESLKEPRVLPTRVPNLLINGSSGIAVGMATNIPPHNLEEIINATIALARDSDLNNVDLLHYVKGPDFPTAGIIYGTNNLQQIYETGRGSIKIRGRAEVVEGKKHDVIIITELPYQVNKSVLLEKIAHLVRDKKIEDISDVRDESNRDGIRVVIDLKRNANSEVILNQLYALTTLQTSFGFNMVTIVSGRPKLLSLRECLHYFIIHRKEVVTRRCEFELREARERFNVLFGLLAAIDSIDKIIDLIRSSKNQKEAKELLRAEKLLISPNFIKLCERILTSDYGEGKNALEKGYLRLNEKQSQAILDMRLARLTGLERDKLEKEAVELRDVTDRLLEILSSQKILMEVIIQELENIRDEYKEPRRTELLIDTQDILMEDLIPEEEVAVTVSHAGYVKRNPINLYQTQHRGGRGKTATTTREDDFVETIFVASTHSYILVFTDRGRVYWLKVYEIPQSSRQARGKPIVNFIKTDKDEKVAAILPVNDFEQNKYLMFVTSKGYIKKTNLLAFSKPRNSGLIALKIDEGDMLINVGITDDGDEVLIGTRQGMAIRFLAKNIRSMGRQARGVRSIKLKKEKDAVVGMVLLNQVNSILTLTENGYGKRTKVSKYRLQNRGGSGVINQKTTAKSGKIASIIDVYDEDEIMIATNRGMLIRVRANQISYQGRQAQGVRVISTKLNESVVSVAKIIDK